MCTTTSAERFRQMHLSRRSARNWRIGCPVPATAKALEQQFVGFLVNCLAERVPTAAESNPGSAPRDANT